MTDNPAAIMDISAIARRERRLSWLFTIVSVAVVVGILLFIWYSAWVVSGYYTQLVDVSERLTASRAELANTESELAENQLALTALGQERDNAETEAARLRAEVVQLSEEAARLGEEAVAASADVAALKDELSTANEQLAGLQEQIRLSADYAEHLHSVDLGDAKALFSISDRIGNLLDMILEFRERDLPFSLANDPEKGFTSPGFADYILRQLGVEGGLSDLPSTIDPAIGDIIRYRSGFALFYMEDIDRQPFVIGMTPIGIAALDPDFGVERTGALSTGLLER